MKMLFFYAHKYCMDLNKIISLKKTIHLLLGLTLLMLGFHALVMTKVLPYDIVWGGRLKSVEQMRIFESISIFTLGLILLMLVIRGEYIQPHVPVKTTTFFFWVFLLVNLVNFIGHTLDLTCLESKIFAPIELLYILLFLRMVVEKGN